MPTVERFQSNVRTQVVRGARAQSLPQQAFAGSQIATAASAAAQGFAELGQRIDTTSAEEAVVQFERDSNKLFFDPESGYFNTQGRNAFDEAGKVNESLENLRKQYEKNLGSDNAKRMFNTVAGRQMSRANQNIQRHAAKGLQSWEIATIQSQVTNTVESAALYWNDDKNLTQQRVLGRLAIQDAAALEGIDGVALNERLQNYDSTFMSTAIEAATATSAESGQELFDKNEKLLEGPDRIKIQNKLNVAASRELEQKNATLAVAEASRIVGDFDNRSDILNEVNKIEDPILRKKTMQEATFQFNQKKQAESEAQAEAYEGAEDHVRTGGSSQEFIARFPDEWDRLSSKQKTTIEKGGVTTSDYAKLSDLLLLPEKELAKVNPTDHFDRLAAPERKQLISAVKSARNQSSDSEKIDSQAGRSRTAETNSAVQQVFGKKSKWNDKEVAQVNAFYATLNDETLTREKVLERKLNSQEYTALLSDFTRKVVSEGFIFDSELDISDVPAEDVPTITKHLRENKIPITADNIIKAYEQAR